MNTVLPFAKEMLQKHGKFDPYGAVLKTSGEVENIRAYDGREKSTSMDLIRLLKQEFVSGAKLGKYKATALVYGIRAVLPSTGKETDVVAISLNHQNNYAVIVMFPYQLINGKLSFGKVYAQRRESDVFPAK